MLDPEAPVARAIFLLYLFEIIQHQMIGFIADGVNRALQSGFIGVADIFFELALGEIVVGHQAGGVGRIVERIEEQGGRRPERAIHKSFDSAEAQPRVAGALALDQIGLPLPLAHGRARINAGRKPPGLAKALENFVVIPQSNVLDGSHARARGFAQRHAQGFVVLGIAGLRDDGVDQVLRGVFEDAGGLARLGIVNDGAARGIFGLDRNSGQAQSHRIGEAHVAIEPRHEYGIPRRYAIDQVFGGQAAHRATFRDPSCRR